MCVNNVEFIRQNERLWNHPQDTANKGERESVVFIITVYLFNSEPDAARCSPITKTLTQNKVIAWHKKRGRGIIFAVLQ